MINFNESFIKEKTEFIRKETLLLHKRAPSTRIASTLSTIEIFSVLFYAGFYNFNDETNRFIISKAHGCFSLYPVLFDFGIISYQDLEDIGKPNAVLGTIPDSNAPKIINNGGALGNGLGVACGIAKAFKIAKQKDIIYVIIGDGEFNEGAVWEAAGFAAYHKLDNLVIIVDDNKKSMLGPQNEITTQAYPLSEKLKVFGWDTHNVNGHNEQEIYNSLEKFTNTFDNKPKALIANTIKGNGFKRLEEHPLCHILTLREDEINETITKMEAQL